MITSAAKIKLKLQDFYISMHANDDFNDYYAAKIKLKLQ